MAKDQMTTIRCEIVLALADCQMRAAAAARKLYIDNATILYHMKLIKAITGKNPRNFYDLFELAQMVKRSREEEGYRWPHEVERDMPNEQTQVALMAMGRNVHGGS